jgi:hypothetical protein
VRHCTPTHDTKQQRPAQPLRGHTQHFHHTAAQHPTHCARNSAGHARPTRAFYIARMTQPRCFTFRRPNAHFTNMPTSAALPDTITPQTCAHRHTRCDKPHPAKRHVSVTARVTQISAHVQPTQRTSHTHIQHTTQAPHARTTSRTATTTAHCASITAHTPPRARHTQHSTQLRPPHKPPTENHTQSHTRPPRHTHCRAVRLPSVDGMLPDSWLLYKFNVLQDTRTAIASHHGPRRRRRPQPAARNASQRIA